MLQIAACLLVLLVATGTLPALELRPTVPETIVGDVITLKADQRKRLAFEAVPIEAGCCYHLTFEARATGQPLIENNPRAHVARFDNRQLFWRWEIHQKSATNTTVARLANSHMSVFSEKWRSYDDLFRAHQQAATATLTFVAPIVPVGLEIRNVRLQTYDNGEAVNLNGDFSLGEYCLAGWGSPFAGADFRTIKGRCVFDTAYGTESVGFPLDDRKAYRVTVQRTTYGGYAAANIYLKHGGKNLKMVSVPRSGTLDFVPPAGTTWGHFKIYNSYLESAIVTPLGPKEILHRQE